MNEWQKIDEIPIWDFKEKGNEEFIGHYESKKENIGKNKSSLYYFKDLKGILVGVWGSEILDRRFSTLEKGQKVKIVYKGKVKGESGFSYNDFDIYKAKMEEKMVEEELKEESEVKTDEGEVRPEDIPF